MAEVGQDLDRQLALLREVYRVATGSTRIALGPPSQRDCARRASLSGPEGESALRWLVGEQLVLAVHGAIRLSHAGVKEIEDLALRPDEATAHFPAHLAAA